MMIENRCCTRQLNLNNRCVELVAVNTILFSTYIILYMCDVLLFTRSLYVCCSSYHTRDRIDLHVRILFIFNSSVAYIILKLSAMCMRVLVKSIILLSPQRPMESGCSVYVTRQAGGWIHTNLKSPLETIFCRSIPLALSSL